MKTIRYLIAVAIILLAACSKSPDPDPKHKPNPNPDPKPNSDTKKIEFKDAKFKAALVKVIDEDKDGEISEKEAAKATLVNVSNKGITDLTGIEYFTNLVSLDISNNQLTSLDASKLTALKTFVAYGNKFSFLDLTACVALAQSNVVSYRGVSKTHYFNGPGNFIKVANAPLAEKLNKYDNNTTVYSAESENKIAEFTDNKLAFAVSVLFGIKEGGVPLSKVQGYTGILSLANKNLTSLDGINQFKSITQLKAYGNNISGVVVIENMPELTSIELGNNKITKIVLRNLPKLVKLELQYNALVEYVQTDPLPSLTTLDVSDNPYLVKLDVNGVPSISNLYMTDVGISGELNLKGLVNLRDPWIKKPKQGVSDGSGNKNISSIVVSDDLKAGSFNDIENTTVYNKNQPFVGKEIKDPALRQFLNLSMPRSATDVLFKQGDLNSILNLDCPRYLKSQVYDLSGIEYCTNLSRFIIDQRIAPTSGFIDLTPFRLLQELEISGPIASVKMGEHSMLKSVKLVTTRLKTLDLSGCPSLTNVDIQMASGLICVKVSSQALADKFNNDPRTKANVLFVNDPDAANIFRTDLCN